MTWRRRCRPILIPSALAAIAMCALVGCGGTGAHPLAVTSRRGPLTAVLRISPGGSGVNHFTLSVKANGQPGTTARRLQMIGTMLEMNMSPQSVSMIRRSPGVYSGTGAISMGGQWGFQIILPDRAGRSVSISFKPTFAS